MEENEMATRSAKIDQKADLIWAIADFPNMAADRYEQNDQFFRKLFDDPDMMKQVMETVGSVLYERLKKKYIFDPKSGVIEEATPETYVEDTYLTEK